MKFKLLIFLIALTLSSCHFLKPDNLKAISPQELATLMEKRDIFLVDVHIPEQKHIKGTDAFIPYNRIAENLDKFPEDKKAPIYLYCESGPMGNAAARVLYQKGYTNIFNLEGGAKAWHEAGFE